jgi:hypothetical protein
MNHRKDLSSRIATADRTIFSKEELPAGRSNHLLERGASRRPIEPSSRKRSFPIEVRSAPNADPAHGALARTFIDRDLK